MCGLLALRLKPIFEARAKQNLSAAGASAAPGKPSLNSDGVIQPIRTDVAVAEAAHLGKDTIRKIERIASIRLC